MCRALGCRAIHIQHKRDGNQGHRNESQDAGGPRDAHATVRDGGEEREGAAEDALEECVHSNGADGEARERVDQVIERHLEDGKEAQSLPSLEIFRHVLYSGSMCWPDEARRNK